MLAGETALEARSVVRDPGVRLRPEIGDDIGRAPVTRDHCGVVAVVVARDGGDVATRAEPRLDLAHTALGTRAVDVAGGHQRDHARVDLAARGGLEAVRRLDRLGRRVGVAVGTHVLGHAEAKCAGDRHGDQRDQQHRATVGMKEGGESAKHWGVSFSVSLRLELELVERAGKGRAQAADDPVAARLGCVLHGRQAGGRLGGLSPPPPRSTQGGPPPSAASSEQRMGRSILLRDQDRFPG